MLFKICREIKSVYSFEAACKCHKHSSVKIRKGTLFLCRILVISVQTTKSPGLQITIKQNLSEEIILVIFASLGPTYLTEQLKRRKIYFGS
jgi:hypothetical protein